MHDRVQNSSGSGLIFVKVSGSGSFGFSNSQFFRVRVQSGSEKTSKTRRVFGFPGLMENQTKNNKHFLKNDSNSSSFSGAIFSQ